MRSLIEESPKTPPIAVSEPEAAKLLGIGERTLEDLRRKNQGPKHKKVGDRILYGVRNLERWVNS